jgi:hypothetical protein
VIAAVQTIKLVHFVLRCKAAEFGCITPLLNGLSLNVRETVMVDGNSNSCRASARAGLSPAGEGFSSLRFMDKLYHSEARLACAASRTAGCAGRNAGEDAGSASLKRPLNLIPVSCEFPPAGGYNAVERMP